MGKRAENLRANTKEHRVDSSAARVRGRLDPSKPDRRIGLVDRAIGLDPEIVFGAALAITYTPPEEFDSTMTPEEFEEIARRIDADT